MRLGNLHSGTCAPAALQQALVKYITIYLLQH